MSTKLFQVKQNIKILSHLGLDKNKKTKFS